MRSANVITRTVVILVFLLVITTGCGGAAALGAKGGSIGENYDLSGATLSVGSKEFTEQLILGYITKFALQAAGADVRDQIGLASSAAARQALTAGYIDMYWDYTGTGWITHLQHTDPIPDRQEQFEAVAKEDLQKNGVKWLAPPAPANNTYAIAVREENDFGVETLSDLGPLIKNNPDQATICVDSEFINRNDGLPGMEKTYGYEFPDGNIATLELGPIYQAVDRGDPCNFGEVFATDGRIAGLDLKVIKDNKEFFPKYNPALTVREDVYEEYPQLQEIFAPISEKLTTETLQQLNKTVDVDGGFPDQVAKDWLQQQGFID
ncbi:MAG: glycine betaine ABC transporter substrate-binding protein [Rubrobacteraceae bacterium]